MKQSGFRACRGKEKHESWEMANAIRRDKKFLNIYKCSGCGYWHLGSQHSGRMRSVYLRCKSTTK